MREILSMGIGSHLDVYLRVPEIRDTFEALRELCNSDVKKLELEEQVALTCAEALRYAYRMSKELGLEKETFMEGLTSLMDAEDRDYRLRHYN